MAKIIKSNINSSGSYKSHGNLSSKHHSSSTTRKEKLKGGGTRAVTDSINSTKTINETQNYATTRSTTITSTRKTRSEYFIPLLSMPFWFVIIFLIMAMGTFNVMMDNNGLGKWELKEEYEIDNVYTLSELQEMQLDTPITELNNHSLREVFEDGNLVVNGDFSEGTAGFSNDGNSVLSISNGNLVITGNGGSRYLYVYQSDVSNINDKIYFKSRVKLSVSASWVSIYDGNQSNYRVDNPPINEWVDINNLLVVTGTSVYILADYLDTTTQNGAVIEVDYVYAINTTSLGIDTLTVSQMDYWYSVYQDILDGSVNKETKAALGTIDYRNPKMIDDDIVYFDYYHMTYEQQEKLGSPALNNLTTVSSVLVGGKYLDENGVQKETPGIFPTLTKLITSVTDVIEWFSDNSTKLIRYVDKGYENIVGETLNDTWKRTKNAWSWLRDQFGIVGGAS